MNLDYENSVLPKDSGESGAVLGEFAARVIVSSCAGTKAWMKTLGDLQLNPEVFRSCVYKKITSSGYKISAIPAEMDTVLADVVEAIGGASR
jgi:hypothetical protein